MRLLLLVWLLLAAAALLLIMAKSPNSLMNSKNKKRASKVKQVMKHAYHLHTIAWNEFRALGSSEFERVLTKATRSSSEQPKEKHLYSILYALSEFDGMVDYQQVDVYAVAMHKVWVKINHEDIRSSMKALYILHSIMRLTSREQSIVIRQRIRRLRDDYCKKTQCNYFDRNKLVKKYSKNSKNSSKYNKLLGYVNSYALYLLIRCQLFSPEFDELLETNNVIKPVVHNATITNSSGDDESNMYTIEYINRLEEEERSKERDGSPASFTEIVPEEVSIPTAEVLSLDLLIKCLKNAKRVLISLLSIRLYPSNCSDLTVACLELIALDLVNLYPKFVVGVGLLTKYYGGSNITADYNIPNGLDKNHRNYVKLLNFNEELNNSQEVASWLTTHTKILTKYGYNVPTMNVETQQGNV